MKKSKKKFLIMFLTIIVSGLMTSMGIFLSSIPILVLCTLLLVSLPFTVYQLVKSTTQKINDQSISNQYTLGEFKQSGSIIEQSCARIGPFSLKRGGLSMNSIGIDIGGTKMIMLAEYEGEKISKIVLTGAKCTSTKIKKEIETFVHELPFNPDCTGIAVPGLVENENTVVLSDVLPNISGMDTNFLRINNNPIYMINDVKAALIYESSLVDEHDDIVVIMVGTGVAIGMKQNGQFINGWKGWAGELGSMPVLTNNGVKKLDELTSGASILTRAKVDANTLHKQIDEGNETAKEIIQSAGEYLGISISTIIHLLNPKKIVL